MKQRFLPYGTQYIDDDIVNDVVEVLRSDFLSQGPKIKEFEQQMAKQVNADYCVAVANGTAALHLAVQALQLPQGRKGITSPITFVASSNSFLYSHLFPEFVDIDEKTYCMDPELLKQKVDEDTGVIIPVHFAGQPCDMETIAEIRRENNPHGDLYIIEDAAHAIGSKYQNGEPVGSCCYSDMTIFSFHPVKTMTTAEGGAITTNCGVLYERLLMLRNHGLTRDAGKFENKDMAVGNENGKDIYGPWYYEMQTLGFNYRMTELQAALGVGQLRNLDKFIARRNDVMNAYDKAFKDIPWLTIPYRSPDVTSTLHLYVLLFDFKAIGKTRSQVMAQLREKGIGTQVHYIPVHLQPLYRQQFDFKKGDFPKSEYYYDHCLSIPIFPKMTGEDIARVVQAIKELGD